MSKSYREQFEAVLKCESREEAERWMEGEVKHYVEHRGKGPTEAMEIIKANLGYMAGYYDDATAKKIHRLFNAVHPIFGTSTYHGDDPKDAFELGKALGSSMIDHRNKKGGIR